MFLSCVHKASALTLLIGPAPILILRVMLVFTLILGMNGANEINVFLISVNASFNANVNADAE